MSASGKLKALTEQPVKNMFKIGDALPQIVAVVEAAEALHERVEMDESVGICLSERVESMNTGAALSALEEALT